MRTLQTRAIILRRVNYGEADRILTLLTPAHGKISAIAKSVRKPKSRLAGGLELFATCEVVLGEGRGGLSLITSARLEHFYGHILHDYERLRLGYEAVKLINRAAESAPEPEFYALLQSTFAYLDMLRIDIRLVELWFRLQLATLLGVGVNVATDNRGQSLEAVTRYNFDRNEMAFVSHSQGRFGAEHIKLLRLAHTKNPAGLQQVRGIADVLDDCVWVARVVSE